MSPLSVTRRHTPRTGATALIGIALTAVLAGCSTQPDALADDVDSTPTAAVTLTYTGGVQQYLVPQGVTAVQVAATGGAGGTSRILGNVAQPGATVTGTVAVTPGQVLLVSVGQVGGGAGGSDTDPKGGWGGLGANGGNGNAASDTLRTGGAGGGATTVQLADSGGGNATTILVAGGAGGDGGPSGNPLSGGSGGPAGCTNSGDPNHSQSWTGGDGGNAGGKGGKAGAQPIMAGARGEGGSGLGGNGGGGGGGVNGGGPGTGASGTSEGGGGGAGSSTTQGMTDTAVTCDAQSGGTVFTNGQVIVTPVGAS